MSQLIPIFPLALVVYPGEVLPLHIFEPRYRQLIQDTNRTGQPFGIPAVIEQKISGLGTLVRLEEIVKTHPGGELDVLTRGEHIFRIRQRLKQVPGKLYGGARVELPPNELAGDPELLRQALASLRLMFKMLKVDKTFPSPPGGLKSYDLAHHAGLSPAQEYELLALLEENQRLAYLNQHLGRLLPSVMELEALKQKIRLNGHFRKLPGFGP